jgi:predicted nucleotidyltransferase component of viral defense system
VTLPVSLERLTREAEATGFQIDTLEKATRLLDLLGRIVADRFLASRLVLKGGTALNLFFYDVPRLSVDLDLNYIGAADVDGMRAERPKIEDILTRLFLQAGYQRQTSPPRSHAGGKWILRYPAAVGGTGAIEVDLNYLLRVPLWDPSRRDSRPVASSSVRAVPVLEQHELAASKIVALLTRRASRDLFDAHRLLTTNVFTPELLRLGIAVYGAASRHDFRQITADRIEVDQAELEAKLLPVLRADARQQLLEDRSWARRLRDECVSRLSMLLPLRDNERMFISRIREAGAIQADLLTDDSLLIDRIQMNPALLWRAETRSAARAPEQDQE